MCSGDIALLYCRHLANPWPGNHSQFTVWTTFNQSAEELPYTGFAENLIAGSMLNVRCECLHRLHVV
jgi:hypothetical protein